MNGHPGPHRSRAKDLYGSCRPKRSDVEQARLSTICSARAEFADFVYTYGIRANPRRNTKCQPIQLSKISVSGSSEPSRAWRNVHPLFSSKSDGTIKNPASSAGPSRPNFHPDGFARCSTICYPEFVTDLSFGWYSETLDRP